MRHFGMRSRRWSMSISNSTAIITFLYARRVLFSLRYDCCTLRTRHCCSSRLKIYRNLLYGKYLYFFITFIDRSHSNVVSWWPARCNVQNCIPHMIQAWNIIVCVYKVDMDIHMQIFSFISHALTYYMGMWMWK